MSARRSAVNTRVRMAMCLPSASPAGYRMLDATPLTEIDDVIEKASFSRPGTSRLR